MAMWTEVWTVLFVVYIAMSRFQLSELILADRARSSFLYLSALPQINGFQDVPAAVVRMRNQKGFFVTCAIKEIRFQH